MGGKRKTKTKAPAKTAPITEEYNGHPILVLNPGDRYPFKFGVSKATLITQHINTIKRFVEKGGKI